MEASRDQYGWLAAGCSDCMRGVCSVLVLAATTLMCVCGIMGWRCLRRPVHAPAGPRALPFIGHLHILGALPHQTLARLSKRFGPLMSLRFGSVPVIVASSPAMAKLILHTHDKIFAGRPQHSIVVTNALQGGSDIGYSPPNSYWKLMRQLCFTGFLSPKRLEYFRPVRTAEVHTLMLSILAAQGTPFSIRELLLSTNSNLISRMVLGASLRELVAGIPNSDKVMSAVLELFSLLGVFNLSDYIPILAWMDLQGYGRRSKKAAITAKAVFQDVIDRHRCTRSSNDPPRDVLDALLSASLNAKHTDIPIGDPSIRAILLDMFSAGVETSAVTIEWALSELLANPQNLKILQEELDRIVGSSRFVQESDLPNLPYLRMVVHETLRLHPPAPLLLPHLLMEPCQISDYLIPKDTSAYVNVWAIHRDPNVWDNPLEFCPERFLDSNIDALGQQCKFLPFGESRRSCPGQKLALITVQTILANLIHAFDWQILGKPHMHEKFGLVVAPEEPLTVVPMPKLPRDLFETFM